MKADRLAVPLRVRAVWLACVVGAWPGGLAVAQDNVMDTVHNLAASGPGQYRAQSEADVCVFCHATHTVTGVVSPLWNREVNISAYQIYESSTLDARPGQPTGTSKLCLSCHDGTLALGSVLSRRDQIRMAGGDRIPAGLTNLGTDLSDDHPVSFTYTSALAAVDRQLASPQTLPSAVKVDRDHQLQCTSCHDPHHNKYGKFLVTSDLYGELCTSCHDMEGWTSCSHRSASATVRGARSGDWPHENVAANACRSCHRSHGAGGRHRLLLHAEEEENCLDCHDGSVAHTDIRSVIAKSFSHNPTLYQGAHDPMEGNGAMEPHVECSDCHNPHAVRGGIGQTGYRPIGPTMTDVSGVAPGGGRVAKAQNEYEVCFRCHGDAPVATSRVIGRQSQQANLRLKFNATNASFHPVVTAARSSDTVSLIPGMARGSKILCTDCHNNDAGPRAGGAGPDGPHGSIYGWLLERNYAVNDNAAESNFAYGLCYKCHRRVSILSDESFPLHRKHIVEERSPCSACHDPHGVSTVQGAGSDHTHLINFDTRIVRPAGASQTMEFRDYGQFSGSCTLTCHGKEHISERYGEGGNPFQNDPNQKRRIIRRRR